MFIYGCNPASLSVNGGSLLLEAAMEGDGNETGPTGTYDLSRFDVPANEFGGNFARVEEGKPYYYVVYNSKGADGGAEAWKQFINDTLRISEYKVVKREVRDTYPGFPAQQTEGIIKPQEPFDAGTARVRVKNQ